MLSKVEDFLKDDDFIRLVLDGKSEMISDRKAFEKNNPEIHAISDEAEAVLLSSPDIESGLSLSEIKELKQRIFTSIGLEVEL